MGLLAVKATERPPEDGVAEPDVIGTEAARKAVLDFARVAVTRDVVALDGHRTILMRGAAGEKGISAPVVVDVDQPCW